MKDILIVATLGCLLWVFLPIIILGVISLVAMVSPRIDLVLRRWVKPLLGLGMQNNRGILMQTKNFDCGTVALRNTLKIFGVHDVFRLSEPSSMKDLAVAAESFGCTNAGYDKTTIELVQQSLAGGGKILTLVKATYPFAGWWVRPTAWLLDFLIGNRVQGIHWVMLDSINSKNVFIVDPYFGRIKMRIPRFYKCWSRSSLILFSSKVGMTYGSIENSSTDQSICQESK